MEDHMENQLPEFTIDDLYQDLPIRKMPVRRQPMTIFRLLQPYSQDSQVPGRRCPSCLQRGHTVWVIPGKRCPQCGTEVN